VEGGEKRGGAEKKHRERTEKFDFCTIDVPETLKEERKNKN